MISPNHFVNCWNDKGGGSINNNECTNQILGYIKNICKVNIRGWSREEVIWVGLVFLLQLNHCRICSIHVYATEFKYFHTSQNFVDLHYISVFFLCLSLFIWIICHLRHRPTYKYLPIKYLKKQKIKKCENLTFKRKSNKWIERKNH